MRRHPTPRNQRPDLLTRPPCRSDEPERGWVGPIDPVASLAELADLRARGLISRSELERQAAKVIGATLPGTPTAVAALTGPGEHPPPRHATRRPACDRASSGGT